MVTLRRIGIVSAGRVGFFFALATSIANVAFALFWLVVINGVPISVLPPDIWFQIALNVFLSSLVMALGVCLFAFLYNLNVGTGGLQLEFDTPTAYASKRKNDEFIDDDDSSDVV